MDEEKYGIVARKKRLLSAYLSRVEGRAGVGFTGTTQQGWNGFDQEMDGYADHVEMTERGAP
jgi:hypothetical protein